ncbi:MAG: hypothetical protein Q4C49_11495 [Bacillota bacterium]|nr:hypothetical protein [Bacillota bacterium]
MNYYSVQYILDLLYLFTGKSVFVTNSKELITLLLVFFLSNLIVHILLQRTKSSEIEYSNLIFAIPSVIALLMKIVLENEALHSIYFFSTVLMIVLPTTGYVTIYYYYKSFENIELENQLRLNQKQLLVSKKQADYLNRLYRENFEDFHKVLHQLKDIGSMIDDVDTEIKEKLETLMSDIDRSYNAYLANSYAMNMAIQYYDKEIKENNISIRNTIFETLYFLPLQEEIEVFKKILEIGIHYCLKVKEEERLIIIQTREYDNRFVLRFSFPYVQEYDEVSNIFTHYFTYQMRIFREIDRELEIETYSLMFPITVE